MSSPFPLPPLPPFLAALPSPLAALPALINHLLKPEAWARARLVPHAGKTVLFVAEPFSLALTVTTDGYVERAAATAEAAVRIAVPLLELPAALASGAASAAGTSGVSQALMRKVRLEGDAEFAHAISAVAGNLRWDAEDDLSKLVGDAAAAQLAAGARGALREIGTAHGKLAANVSEYLLEENPLLVRPRSIDAFSDAVRTLRDDLARLEKRVERLTPGPGGSR